MANTQPNFFFQPETKSIKIWRYVDFAHFVEMLERGGLWFSSLPEFRDPYEGFHPLELPNYRKLFIQERREKYGSRIDDSHVNGLIHFSRQLAASAYANCWNESETESAAFWNLYGSEGKAIAIQTRYELLDGLLDDQIYLGKVVYLPEDRYLFPLGNPYLSLMHKRTQFAHEKEVRALFVEEHPRRCIDRPGEYFLPPRKGDWVDIDLRQLIEQVVISPTANYWLAGTVERISRKYAFNFSVEKSKLLTRDYNVYR